MPEQNKDDCVGGWIKELKDKHPDWADDQIKAVALKKCGESNQGKALGDATTVTANLDSADKAGAQLSKGNAGMIADMLKMGHSLLKKTGMGHMIPSVDEEYGAGDDEDTETTPDDEAAEGEAPDDKKKSLPERAIDWLRGQKDMKAQGFQPIGENGWVAWWSNNFEDREKELFPEKALDAYIWRVDNNLVPKPELWFWQPINSAFGHSDRFAVLE